MKIKGQKYYSLCFKGGHFLVSDDFNKVVNRATIEMRLNR